MLAKKFSVLLFLICGGTFLLAAAADISVQVEPQARILKGSDKLQIQVSCSFPEDRFLAAHLLSAYLPYLPKNFSEASGIAINENKDPRWSSLRLRDWQWMEGEKRRPGKLSFEVDSSSWPPGDYKLEWRGLFRKTKSSVETDLYHSAYFYLTITEP